MQILSQNKDKDIGMSERGFKMFMAKSMSDLYAIKMIESIGSFIDRFQEMQRRAQPVYLY